MLYINLISLSSLLPALLLKHAVSTKVEKHAKNKQVNIVNVFDKIARHGDQIDEPIKDMVTGVMTYQINEIQKVLNKKLADEKKQKREEEESLC